MTTDQQEAQADAPFALSSSVVETSAGGAAEGLASIHRGLEIEGLGGVGVICVWMCVPFCTNHVFLCFDGSIDRSTRAYLWT